MNLVDLLQTLKMNSYLAERQKFVVVMVMMVVWVIGETTYVL